MTIAATGLALAALLAADGGVGPPAAPSLVSRPVKAAERTYELRPAKDGTGDLVYEATAFTARVARDGAARFVDKHIGLAKGWSLIPFIPLPMPSGRPSLQGVVLDFLGKRRGAPPRPPDGNEPPPDPPMPVPNVSRYRPDPREACRYPQACYFQPVPTVGVTGSFDLTDELLRFNGEDPYRREKALFLAATREQRAGMAARAVAADVRRASAELGATLAAIACDERRSVAERRAVIEALRGELDGDTPAAREAQAAIARFLSTRFDGADGGVRCDR
jgi:hypothetical protein